MAITGWIVVGLIIGWLAGLVVRGGYGVISDILFGIVGASIGGLLASSFLALKLSEMNLESIVIATAGAGLVVIVGRLVLNAQRSMI